MFKRLLFVLLTACLLASTSQAATTLLLNDQGASQILTSYFNNTLPSNKNLQLKLFCNNITPSDTDTTSTYTECSGGGYTTGGAVLTNGSWTVSASGDIEQAAYAQQTFTFTGPLTTNTTIYGYYIVDNAGTPNVIYVQLLNAPMTPVNNGDALKITPIFQLSHGTPAS